MTGGAMTWEPIFLLPNIRLDESVETEFVVLAAPDDPRLEALKESYPKLSDFLSRFSDQFEVEATPAVLLMRSDAPVGFRNLDAIASFRDAIAISSVCGQRAKTLVHERGFHPQYADWYDFFPWMLTIDYKYLACQTPAFRGVHVVEEFRGQTSPSLTPISVDTRAFDRPLLSKLLLEWKERYSADDSTWRSTALFRSLNMAMSAARMPGSRDVTIFSIGRSLSLWVSAFEILVHPRDGQSGYRQVYELLGAVDLISKECKERQYLAYPYRPGFQRQNLLCWIYGEINRIRNDFLHGNPVSIESLKDKTSGRNFYEFGAVLYRLALTAFLPIKRVADSALEFDRGYFDFVLAQRDAEAAIRKILIINENPD